MKSKHILTLIIVIGLIGFFLYSIFPRTINSSQDESKANKTAQIAEGSEVPYFELQSINGNRRTLKDYKGKVILINFWASWCGPCNEEAPSLEAMYNKLKNEGVTVVSISIDNNAANAESFVKKYSITFPVLFDPDETVAASYGLTGVPETFILTPDYKLLKHVIGPLDWTSYDVINYLKTIIKE